MQDGIVSRSERYIASGSAAFSPSLNATVGDVGETSTSKRSSGGVLARDHRPHLLRLAVVGLVVAGRERVGAEHDPPLRLVAEAGVARPLDHLVVAVGVDAEPVADAVVAGEVRGRLGGSDQVVAGEPVLDRARQLALPTSAPRSRASSIALWTAAATPGSIPSASFISFGTPIRRPFRLSPSGELDLRDVDGGRVGGVAARR